MATIALIDADIPAHAAATAVQHDIDWGDDVFSNEADSEEGEHKFRETIERIQKKVRADRVILAFSDTANFRLSVLPSYKSNRAHLVSPLLKKHLKAYGSKHWESFTRPTLEGDDVIGILATRKNPEGHIHIQCSIDKDMKTIPGVHYDFNKDAFFEIDEGAADYWHLYQTLVGDSVDGYKGCPGIGHVKAENLLKPFITYDHHGDLTGFNSVAAWGGVVKAYEAKGLTEEDALTQARVARICRASDYDFISKTVKLWTPQPSSK